MVRSPTGFEKIAADAADRIDRDKELAVQLTLLPDQVPEQVKAAEIGRPKGAKNKGSSQMREWLTANGFQLPEAMLVQMAGLASSEDALTIAMQKTERILAWAQDGAGQVGKEGNKKDPVPTMGQRTALFMQIYAIQLRAAEAMLPYGAAKVSGDVKINAPTYIHMPGAPAPAPGAAVRDITPVSDRRMAPPPMPDEIQQNQTLSETNPDNPDSESRTE